MASECVLCCDETHLFGITECNHGPFCYRCVYKMRALSKNNSCPICKHQSKQIMIAEQFLKFGDYKGEVLPDSNFGDVFHCGKLAKKEFEKLKQYKCWVRINGKPCRNDKSFENVAFLKKHLKEEHKRVYCDVCFEKKTCVLEEQKLYTRPQLNKHLERGDMDQFGNVIFLHPYCSFCKQYFFDEDEFKRHMGLQHMTCNVCGAQEKYTYYRNYDSLETHYKISHYICADPDCLAKKFIAFRSGEELKVHRAEIHSTGNKKIDAKQLCGFGYAGINAEEVIEIKDKEGINMEDQFITLKKSKNRVLGEADQQRDQVVDVRDFYHTEADEQQHYREAFVLKHRQGDDNSKTEAKQATKKKKYIDKQQFEKQKPVFAKQNENFTIEELNLVKTLHLPRIFHEQFESKLRGLISGEDIKKIEGWKVKNAKRQLSTAEFIQNFLDLMKKVSLKTGYEIFPHYIRTFNNEDLKEELNYEYVKLLKKIPSKNKCMLSSCNTYGDIFKQLLKQIESNIEQRIRSKKLSIKRPIKRQKQRLFQLIGVVRRLKIQQMGKFKFASNFGVFQKTSELIINKVFRDPVGKIQQYLDQINNEQFIDLYVFVKYCLEAISRKQNLHLSKNKIHELVLEDYLFERPELEQKFGMKRQQLKTLDEQVQFEKQQEEKNNKKKLKDIEKKNKDLGYNSRANFSMSDKSEFPDLVEGKKSQQQMTQNFRDVVETAKSKPATYQKKINELFPTLGGPQNNDQNEKKQQKDVPEKKEKAWWEKINEPKYEDGEQEEVVKIRKGKNKKQKWVSAKGFF